MILRDGLGAYGMGLVHNWKPGAGFMGRRRKTNNIGGS